MKLSVIIPAYNVQDYIIKCLDSLRVQEYDDAEFLIVDDGSTDDTSKRIMEYLEVKKDSRFKYFYKENGGLSDARNYGIKKASGDYIWYFDSDDYIPDDTRLMEKLINKAEGEKPDLLIFNFKYDKNWPVKYANQVSNLKEWNGMVKGVEILKQRMFNFSVWHTLFNKEFLRKNQITFKKGSTSEDLLYTSECLLKANRVLACSLVGYVYVYRDNSITKSTDAKKVSKRIKDVTEATLLIDQKMRNLNLQSNTLVSGFIAQSMTAFATGYVSISRKKMRSFFKGKSLNLKENIKKCILLYAPEKIRKFLCKKILSIK